MHFRALLKFLIFTILAISTGLTEAQERVLPLADHHQHLLSKEAAALESSPSLPAVKLPEELTQLIRARESGWNDKTALMKLYSSDAVAMESRDLTWRRGQTEVATYESELFARPYKITPISYEIAGSAGHIAGYFTRGEGEATKHFGHVHLSLRKAAAGDWQVSAETDVFPGPTAWEPIDSKQLIAQLDEAGIQKAAVLSLAYWFGSPLHKPIENEYEHVKRENDWTSEQVALYPKRLIGFCSVNPLKEYALDELNRCATKTNFKGLKLHFGNSVIDLKNAEHVKKIQQVFRTANKLHFPIIAHLWTDPEYGRDEAEIFLNQIMPSAPDVVIQIAHMAGGGPGWTDQALAVYADAISKHDPRTRNLYFDVATVADEQSYDQLKQLAVRIRQIGTKRILYGSDASFGGRNTARVEWGIFRGMVPLSEQEIQAIAKNVAPYFH